jgi:hypothetical protein
MKKPRKAAEVPAEALSPWLPGALFTTLICGWTTLIAALNYKLAKPFLPELSQFGDLISAVSPIFAGGMATRLIIVLAFWLIASAAGERLLPFLGITSQRSLERKLVGAGVGFGVVSLALLCLGLAGFWRAGLLKTLFIIAATASVPAHFFQRAHSPEPTALDARKVAADRLGLLENCGTILIAIATTTMFLSTAAPDIFYDSLVYHLALPKLYLIKTAIVPTAYNVFSGAPQGAQMLYGLMLSLGDERLTTLLHFSFGLGTALVLWLCSTIYSSRSTGILSATLFLCCPIVMYSGTFSGVDLISAFYCALAFYAVLRSLEVRSGEPTATDAANRGWAVCAGILLGLAMATKYNVFSVGASLLAVHLYLSISRGLSIRWTAWMSLAAFVTILPWLLKNTVFYGNPLYPFFHGLRTGGPHPADWSGFLSAAAARDMRSTFFTAAGWKGFLLLPWTFSQGEVAMDNWPGGVFLLLIPWLFVRNSQGVFKAAALAALTGYLTWSLASTQGRFIIPVLPMIVFALAVAVNHTITPAWLKSLSWSAALLLCVFNLAANTHQNLLMGRWAFLKSGAAPAAYLRDERFSYPVPAQNAIEFINTNTPAKSKVIFLGEARGYYSDRDFVAPTVFDQNPFWTSVSKGSDAQDIRDQLAAAGFTHILLNGRGLYMGSPDVVLPNDLVQSKKFDEFWFHHLKPIFEDHDEKSGNPKWLFVYEILSTPSKKSTQQFNLPRIVLTNIQHKS